jgi:hypothetical protein
LYKHFIRPILRRSFFSFLKKLSKTDDFRSIIYDTIDDTQSPPKIDFASLGSDVFEEYPLLGRAMGIDDTRHLKKAIFITGRFRSGTTLLWNIFRQMESVTAYYEPFNERRWFDSNNRGNHTDLTHMGVKDYWSEYEGLEQLSQFYDVQWIDRNLYMSSHSWNPGMKRYIDSLILHAPALPVLQFNRVDFRLPWLKANYRNAKLIHIFRNPRDQWCSFLGSKNYDQLCTKIENFNLIDRYYLLNWAQDLKYHFPVLDLSNLTYAYELFFLMWKLSFCFGKNYSDISISFESLVNQPEDNFEYLSHHLNIEPIKRNALEKLVNKTALDKWKLSEIDTAWFKNIETGCEQILEDYYSTFPIDNTITKVSN